MGWQLFRHKSKPGISYYVRDMPDGSVEIAGHAKHTFHPERKGIGQVLGRISKAVFMGPNALYERVEDDETGRPSPESQEQRHLSECPVSEPLRPQKKGTGGESGRHDLHEAVFRPAERGEETPTEKRVNDWISGESRAL